MRYSLASLTIMMLLGGPALAGLWWLRNTWSMQVVFILVLETTAVCFVCGVLSALIAAAQWLAVAVGDRLFSRGKEGPRRRTTFN